MHTLLNSKRTSDGIDHARKLDKKTVTHCFEQATIMSLQAGFNLFGSMIGPGEEDAFLIFAHKARVTYDIGGQDRR